MLVSDKSGVFNRFLSAMIKKRSVSCLDSRPLIAFGVILAFVNTRTRVVPLKVKEAIMRLIQEEEKHDVGERHVYYQNVDMYLLTRIWIPRMYTNSFLWTPLTRTMRMQSSLRHGS